MSDGSGGPAVRSLVFEYLERSEYEGHQVLEEICAREPEHAEALRTRVEILAAKGLTPSTAEARHPDRVGVFELLERLGGGGMGIVYRARDESLGRDVALKLVRPGELYFPGARERFQRESEAIARLSHPGIVPVHAAGEEDDVPYFAMELVEGCTLAEAMERLADTGLDLARASGRDLHAVLPGEGDGEELPAVFRGSWSETCARIVREVAEALEHAHRRGVLHRDVKPSNVMITRSGRVMLIDFGLAFAEGGERITRTGSAMGSLAYLSPEQLEGEWQQLDARADVYSLGVTLYEMLTLRLPYRGDTVSKLRAAVLEAGAPPPRRFNPAVSWELDTITEAAMRPERERRYASAAAFAADLSAALDGRPIAARRSSAVLRARRWVTRHPARAALLALTVLVVVGGPLGYSWQEREARLAIEAKSRVIEQRGKELAAALDDLEDALRVAREQRDEARRQEGRADRNFQRAREAVDTMLTRLAQDELRDVPRLHELRRRVLEDALAFYIEFLEEHDSEPELRLETARAWHRVADLHAMLDDAEEAEGAFAQAIELYGLVIEEESSPELLAERAKARHRRFFPLRQLGRLDAAEENLSQGKEEIAAALEASPGRREYVVQRASLTLQEAGVLTERGQWREAIELLEEVVPELEEAYVDSEGEREAVSTLAQAHHQLGVLWAQASSHSKEERIAESLRASEHHARVVELIEPALKRFPVNVRLRHQLSRSLVNLGSTRLGQGEPVAAEPLLRRGAELTDELCRDYPGVDTYVSDRAVVRMALGAALVQLGKEADGLSKLRDAIRDFEDLVRWQPTNAGLTQQLAGARLQLGISTWLATRDPGEAIPLLERAAEAHRAALGRAPNMPQARMGLAWCLDYRSSILLSEGAIEDAADATLEWAEALPDRRNRVDAALRFAQCAAAVAADEGFSPEDREELAARYDDTAAALLDEALEAGLTPAEVRSNPKYQPLLERPLAALPLELGG